MEFLGNKIVTIVHFVAIKSMQKSIILGKNQKICGNPTLRVIELVRLWLMTIFCGEITEKNKESLLGLSRKRPPRIAK